MSDRMVTFNLDKLLATLQRVGPKLPNMLRAASAAGVPIPASLGQYVPLLPMAAELFADFAADSSGASGLTREGLPDTGPLGRGRMAYLRRSTSWTDDEVVRAVEMLTSPDLALPAAKEVIDTVNLVCEGMFSDANGNFTSHQTRQAIDHVLRHEGNEGLADKLGDHIHTILRNGLAKPQPDASTVADEKKE